MTTQLVRVSAFDEPTRRYAMVRVRRDFDDVDAIYARLGYRWVRLDNAHEQVIWPAIADWVVAIVSTGEDS